MQAVGNVDGALGGAGWLQGLKIVAVAVAVAVVAHALWGLATKLTPDRPRVTVALLAAVVTLLWPTQLAQLLCIVVGGLVGWLLLPKVPDATRGAQPFCVSKRLGGVLLAVFAALLLGLPWLQGATGSFGVAVFSAFYCAGSLVFGGGHVVLPLLQAEVVPPGWVTNETFTAGYGAAQAVPGPLFTFSAFLGAVMKPGLAGLGTALLALVGIFTPRFCCCSGCCRSGTHCGRPRPYARRCAASTRSSSACCWRRFTTRSGRARSSARRTWQGRSALFCYSHFSACPRGRSW